MLPRATPGIEYVDLRAFAGYISSAGEWKVTKENKTLHLSTTDIDIEVTGYEDSTRVSAKNLVTDIAIKEAEMPSLRGIRALAERFVSPKTYAQINLIKQGEQSHPAVYMLWLNQKGSHYSLQHIADDVTKNGYIISRYQVHSEGKPISEEIVALYPPQVKTTHELDRKCGRTKPHEFIHALLMNPEGQKLARKLIC